MATLQDHQLLDVLVDGGESAKSLKRPAMGKLLAMIDGGQVKTVIVAKLDRLTRSVRDLCELLERFERRGVHWSLWPNRWIRARPRDGWC
jgi:site-specific DNA recombinase